MITFLSSPKAFVGDTGTIQQKAIHSWLALHKEVEVIIYGDGKGVADNCRELRVCHVPDISCSPSGVPYFNGIVGHAKVHAKYNVQCYLNCDIILTESILKAIKALELSRYLVTGQRIDLAEKIDIDMTTYNWKEELWKLIEQGSAIMHPPSGMDYFIFPRGLWDDLPPLVIGRGGYDNALLAFCLRQMIPIIDATASITVLHQFHDYRHVPGAIKEAHEGNDANDNKRIHGVVHSVPLVSDSDYQLIDGNLLRINSFTYKLRRFELYLRFRKGLLLLSYIIRAATRILGIGKYK